MTRRTHARQALLAGYALVLLVPLALIAGVMKPGAQGQLVVFADALGFAAVSLLALQVAVSGRWATTTRAFGLRAVLSLHRQAGIAVLVLVIAHVVVLLAADPSRIALLDELTAPPRARAGALRPGAEILVDGPHGEAVDEAAAGRMLVAAGIGITPALSVIRTAAESGDRRPLILLYRSRTWEEVTFREDLAALAARLPNLRVVHVLSRPGRGWLGERGRIGAEHLRRHAPASAAGWRALVCGPPGLVATASATLRALGLPVQVEGFED